MMNWQEILRRVAAVFFPERCVLCGDVVAFDDFSCGNCAFEPADCSDCGPLLGHAASVAAVAAYADGIVRLIHTLKETPDYRVAGFFTEQMAALTRQLGWQPELVAPVPPNPVKLAERGFDHAELLARGLAERLLLPLCGDLLGRRADTRTQRELSERERLENAQKSYYLNREDMAAGKTILLVDDVLTTGATAAACAGRLLEGGAADVYILAAAHTVRRD